MAGSIYHYPAIKQIRLSRTQTELWFWRNTGKLAYIDQAEHEL